MFGRRIRAVVEEAGAHGNVVMNDIQGLAKLIGNLAKAAAEDFAELTQVAKDGVKEAVDGFKIETTVQIDLRKLQEQLVGIANGEGDGMLNVPLTLTNRFVLLEGDESKTA